MDAPGSIISHSTSMEDIDLIRVCESLSAILPIDEGNGFGACCLTDWEPVAMIVGLDALGRGLASGIVKAKVFSDALDELPIPVAGRRNLQIHHERNIAKCVSFLKLSGTSRVVNGSSAPTFFKEKIPGPWLLDCKFPLRSAKISKLSTKVSMKRSTKFSKWSSKVSKKSNKVCTKRSTKFSKWSTKFSKRFAKVSTKRSAKFSKWSIKVSMKRSVEFSKRSAKVSTKLSPP
ncbi:hypothetical protein M9H77_22954 [Catharanthus roseus]|uniref:Uncharacterized protein n=1 Tax=Catharanthus roseus TaxID=4058 RepID=A0ACC0AVY5_CATRO|nr:hypothetical protein M9H77_22954 [Catharanthus roseus]